MPEKESEVKTYIPSELQNRYRACANRFQQAFGKLPDFAVRAPGRVNLIGEHTDYNGYPVLPVAIERDFFICAAGAQDGSVHIQNADPVYPERSFRLADAAIPYPRGDWGNYIKAAAVGLDARFPLYQGFQAMVDGNIPAAAGLSSSSALVVGMALCFLKTNDLPYTPIQLAELLARAEQFVGTAGGGMDQAISLLARRNHALLIDFFPLRSLPVPVPHQVSICICHSLVQAPKSAAAKNEYNRRPIECHLAAALIAHTIHQQTGKHIAANRLADVDMSRTGLDEQDYQNLVDQALSPGIFDLSLLAERLCVTPETIDALYLKTHSTSFKIPSEGFEIRNRYDHVIREAGRVRQAAHALENRDLARVGKLMDESHKSCRDYYGISTPELDALAEIGRESGALGARLTGAGFGGCTVHLVRTRDISEFRLNVFKKYYQGYLADKRPDLHQQVKSPEQVIFTSAPACGAGVMRPAGGSLA